ncbi:hypothetical protein T484DRAFT_2224754 [Baffinella frigidus]|nr:hypothetical protein T484DRAFT_2224754 [Cryptophyta sp. CCMP2293]
MRWEDGTSYEGEWRQDMQQGFGVEVYPDGGVYTGQFHGNARHGIGMYAFADGQAYAGQFRFGLQHGPGVLTVAEEGAEEIFTIFDQGKMKEKFAASEGNSGEIRRDVDGILHKAERVVKRSQLRADAMAVLVALEAVVPPDFAGEVQLVLPEGVELLDPVERALAALPPDRHAAVVEPASPKSDEREASRPNLDIQSSVSREVDGQTTDGQTASKRGTPLVAPQQVLPNATFLLDFLLGT